MHNNYTIKLFKLLRKIGWIHIYYMDWSVSQLCHSELSLYVFFNYENDAIIFFIVFLFLQSLENCVCILHNLTYQLETEMPSLFTKINALATYTRNRSSPSDAGPIGCFSTQSQKLQQEVCNFTPHYRLIYHGVSMLW